MEGNNKPTDNEYENTNPKYEKDTNFRISTYKILLRLTDAKHKQYPAQIARQIGMPINTLHYRIKTLSDDGIIKKDFRSNVTSYSLTDKGKLFLESMKPGINTKMSVPHKIRKENLCYAFPILKDNEEAQWQGEVNHNTWKGKKDILTHPINMTLEKTTKSLKVYFHKMYFEASKEGKDRQDNLIRRALLVVENHMRKKGIIIDLFNGKTVSSEEANEMPELEGKMEKSRKKSIDLGRQAKNIFPFDQGARAWIDFSPGQFPDIETNDYEYEDKWLLMPEYIDVMFKQQKYIMQNQHAFAKNIELHMDVLKEMKESQIAIASSLKELIQVVKELKG